MCLQQQIRYPRNIRGTQFPCRRTEKKIWEAYCVFKPVEVSNGNNNFHIANNIVGKHRGEKALTTVVLGDGYNTLLNNG